MATPNKGYSTQTTGTNRGVWGTIINAILTIIDLNFGGRLVKSVAGSANITVSASEAQNVYHYLTGILTGNIKYILPNMGGFFYIENQTTGAFTLTVVSDAAGTGVVVDQGTIKHVFVDAADTRVDNITGSGAAVTDATIATTDITTNNASTSKHGWLKKLSGTVTEFLDGTGNFSVPPVTTDATLTTTDITTNNASTSKHGLLKKLSNTVTEFMNGQGAWAAIKDSDLDLTDITTNNASTSKHGWLKKLSGNASEYMDGSGNYSTPTGSAVAATQAEQETATSTSAFVSPGRQQFHPSAAKCWLHTTGTTTPVIGVSYNITSITDTGVGVLTVTIATDFSSVNNSVSAFVYANSVNTPSVTGANCVCGDQNGSAAGTIILYATTGSGTLTDPAGYNVQAFGDQ